MITTRVSQRVKTTLAQVWGMLVGIRGPEHNNFYQSAYRDYELYNDLQDNFRGLGSIIK